MESGFNREAFQSTSESAPDTYGVKRLLTSFARKSMAVLPVLTVVSALGCDKPGCDSKKPKNSPKNVVTESAKPPSKTEVRRAQEEIMGLLREFMKKEVDVDVPENIELNLSRTQEDYDKAGGRITGLHSIGFYSDDQIYINANRSSELIKLSKANDGNPPESVSCSTVEAAGTLIHELAHALTKDFKSNKQGDYAYFTRTMHEALAVEVEAFAPAFVRMVLPKTKVPGEECSGPAVVKVEDQRYEIKEYKGAYPDQVVFETYLFVLSGACDEEILVNNGTWATCSLKALMNEPFNQYGAGKYLTEIKNRNPKCKTKSSYTGQLDAALMYADAPYLQYAISQCDGGEKIPDVVCSQIQMIKQGDPHIMDSMTLTGKYPNGDWTGWKQTFKDLENGDIYDLDKPLRFRDGIFPMYNTYPTYSSTFTRPHSPDDPCTIEFKQNFYCNSFQLSGFDSDVPVYVFIRSGGRVYVKGSYSEGVTVNTPLLEGSDVYVNVGNRHLKPSDLEISGDETCTISPKRDSE